MEEVHGEDEVEVEEEEAKASPEKEEENEGSQQVDARPRVAKQVCSVSHLPGLFSLNSPSNTTLPPPSHPAILAHSILAASACMLTCTNTSVRMTRKPIGGDVMPCALALVQSTEMSMLINKLPLLIRSEDKRFPEF
jgi:hypothetical protein